MTDLRNEPRLTSPRAQDLADRYHQKLAGDLGGDLPPSLRPDALRITETLTDSQLADRREFIRGQFFTDITDPAKAPNYVQEIFYFVPLALALQLQRSGQYLVALDWIETFYTDHFAAGERKIYHGLVLEETIPTAYQRNPDNWLRVGLNPPRDRHRTRQRAHPVHADDAGPLLPRLRRRRVRPRRGRVDRAGPAPSTRPRSPCSPCRRWSRRVRAARPAHSRRIRCRRR